MPYGQISRNDSINNTIYRCFDYICSEDQRKFIKKFRDQPNDSEQIMHTFRELILGAYLNSMNLKVVYDYWINNESPDWCILDSKSSIKGIIELTNFHIDRLTEKEIKNQMEKKGISLVWRKNKKVLERLYQCILLKIQKYQDLVKKLRIPYIVAVFGDFLAAVKFEEVIICLNNKKIGLFKLYPELSGVLYFQELSGRYFFEYKNNPNALRISNVPNGSFPLQL